VGSATAERDRRERLGIGEPLEASATGRTERGPKFRTGDDGGALKATRGRGDVEQLVGCDVEGSGAGGYACNSSRTRHIVAAGVLAQARSRVAEEITFRVEPQLSTGALDELYANAWPGHEWHDLQGVLKHSLTYVCAYADERVIGFVNFAWDGGQHAFVLDTAVHVGYRRRGIGRGLVEHGASIAQSRGIEWLHVDYEPHLESFYAACGFRPTAAGVRNLGNGQALDAGASTKPPN
jgi:ribosomal protein S18 acetylase RimI-like enzyme